MQVQCRPSPPTGTPSSSGGRDPVLRRCRTSAIRRCGASAKPGTWCAALLGRWSRRGLALRLHDGKAWEFDRVVFRDPTPIRYMLECPDLFRSATSGSSSTARWARSPRLRRPERDNAGYVVGTGPRAANSVAHDHFGRSMGRRLLRAAVFESPDGSGSSSAGWARSALRSARGGRRLGGPADDPRELTLDDGSAHRRNRWTNSTSSDSGMTSARGRSVPTRRWCCRRPRCRGNRGRHRLTAPKRNGSGCARNESGNETLVAYDDLAHRVVVDRRRSGAGQRSYRAAPIPGDSSTCG